MVQWVNEQDGLTIVVTMTGSTARVAWKGVSDARNPGAFLNPLLQDWTEKLKHAAVTVDLTGLDYMNSATVMPLISFIKQLDANGKPISLVFGEVDWQRTHRNCMAALARTLSNVQVE